MIAKDEQTGDDVDEDCRVGHIGWRISSCNHKPRPSGTYGSFQAIETLSMEASNHLSYCNGWLCNARVNEKTHGTPVSEKHYLLPKGNYTITSTGYTRIIQLYIT